MTHEQRSACISELEALPRKLREAISGLNDAQLDTSYRKGGWTVRQVVHHVADSHINAAIRMRLTLTEEQPTIKLYDQDDWAILSDYSLPLEPSLQILEGVHLRLVVLLRALQDKNDETIWLRTAFHPEYKKLLSLDDFVQMYAEHGNNHIRQITELRTIKGW